MSGTKSLLIILFKKSVKHIYLKNIALTKDSKFKTLKIHDMKNVMCKNTEEKNSMTPPYIFFTGPKY